MADAAQDFAVYIHWPFCKSKCPYCDFNSHVSATIDHRAWREAYVRELQSYAEKLPGRHISSVFFGGGTPSLMEAATAAEILETINKYWGISSGTEITLEANPTSVEAQKFADFRAAGVNRLSLGVQSLRNDDLKFLGREHDADQAKRAIAIASQNFPRYSFDLIYARKDQTLEGWRDELKEALSLANGHLSLYQLTIEPNTQFYTLANRGEKLTAPEGIAADMYEMTQEIVRSAGLPAYEISNHATPGMESRHNLTYWRYNDYIGIGPGAHGRYKNGGRTATENHRAPEVWLNKVHEQGNGLRVHDPVDDASAKREALLMGLRLTDGIVFDDWRVKFGEDLNAFIPATKTEKLLSENYLKPNKKALQATEAGLQRLNAVLDYLLN